MAACQLPSEMGALPHRLHPEATRNHLPIDSQKVRSAPTGPQEERKPGWIAAIIRASKRNECRMQHHIHRRLRSPTFCHTPPTELPPVINHQGCTWQQHVTAGNRRGSEGATVSAVIYIRTPGAARHPPGAKRTPHPSSRISSQVTGTLRVTPTTGADQFARAAGPTESDMDHCAPSAASYKLTSNLGHRT